MAFAWTKVEALVECSAVADRVEAAWDEKIEKGATQNLAITFKLQLSVQNRPDVVDELKRRYEGAGWKVTIPPLHDLDRVTFFVLEQAAIP